MIRDKSFWSRLFDCINYIFLTILAIIAIFPFFYVFISSFASVEDILSARMVIIPRRFTLEAYKFVFDRPTIMRSFMVTTYVTVAGTMLSLVLTTMMAYSLAHKEVYGRRVIMFLITFTMLFSGGMIPGFLLVRSLHMIDKYHALFVPAAISAFNLIVMKNFFQSIPKELEESAMIDGAGDPRIILNIVLPLSTPVLATIALFYSVNYWNSFMSGLLYINTPNKWPLQVLLRQVVMANIHALEGDMPMDYLPPESVKYATITVATVPMLLIYPFLQKYFTKGLMLGSIKG